LSGEAARVEILGDKPAPGVEFAPSLDGFQVLAGGDVLYNYNPTERILTGVRLPLPECQISPTRTRIGSNTFSSNTVTGFEVGIRVTEDGIAIGARLPSKLAALVA
jgi:hypothetical protein